MSEPTSGAFTPEEMAQFNLVVDNITQHGPYVNKLDRVVCEFVKACGELGGSDLGVAVSLLLMSWSRRGDRRRLMTTLERFAGLLPPGHDPEKN